MTSDGDFTRLRDTFDIEDACFANRFEDALEYLVDECPVARSLVGPGYQVFNRYADVRRCAQDWRAFSSADGWMMDPPQGNIHILPEDSDPPYHTAWRQVLNPFFSAKAVDRLEQHARRYAGELVDRFADRGHCEYVKDFASQLPGLILFKHILPVPVEDLPTLFGDIDTYSFGPLTDRAPAFGRVHVYLERLLEARRNKPAQGDLIDVLLAGVDRDGSPCPWEDKVHTALDIVFGGLATTTHAMSGALYEMARQPAVRDAVIGDPVAMRAAVEETVRLYAPVVMVARTVRKDVQIGELELEAGARIALNFAAASRDPDVCANPREFDVTRNEVVHTAFGVGPHRCIGEHLARLEIRVAIEEFLKRIPNVALQSDTPPQYESGQLRTMKHLHLNWTV
jgi:cytochrome P450